jgi:gliding motility-associated protein GldC
MTNKKSEIKFTVELDENKLPVEIKWSATDSELEQDQSCKSVLLAMWDAQAQTTLKIDLWTKDMTVDEMKRFFHQTLVSMADTLQKATGEEQMAGDFRDFSRYFAEKLGIINKQS